MEFIYDRTRGDVDRVTELNKKYLERTITDEEKKEWAGNLKGAINIADMNRIEGNIAVIANFLGVLVTTRTWIAGDIPRVADYQRIRDNVESLRATWHVISETPETPNQPLNTYQKWNDIERILHDLNYTYEGYINSFNYCGAEIYAGEGIGEL